MNNQDLVMRKIMEKQEKISEEKQLKKKKKSINKLALTSSLILFLVTLIGLIRILLNVIS